MVFDQAVKFFLLVALRSPGDSYSWKSFMEFYIIYNKGIAFGLGENTGWLLMLLLGVIFVVFIVLYFRYLRGSYWVIQVAVGMVFGGAISNIIDRITRGAVVDYISVFGLSTFNIADCGIVLGVIVVIASVIFCPRLINDKLTEQENKGNI